MSNVRTSVSSIVLALSLVAFGAAGSAEAQWKPTKTVELIVPAGTGGGADQMARMIQGTVTKNKLMDQSMVVINRSGGAGAEGFMDVVGDKGNDHKLIITLSNLFTTPMATGVPFTWKDMTPVAMLALDNFVLWVNADSDIKTVDDFIAAVKKGDVQMGGTGSKQEDQLIIVAISNATGGKITYLPYKGGGDVAAQLVGNHIDGSVNNPIEGVSHWQGEKLRPLCVFAEQPMQSVEQDGKNIDWGSIPPCKSEGLDVSYQMLRGIFMPAGVDQEVVDYYVDLFKKVRETDDWKNFMTRGAFDTSFKVGDEFKDWLANAETQHHDLMETAGFLAK